MPNTPFSPKPICAECDWNDLVYFACYPERIFQNCVLGGNHIHMTCARCGFVWVMDPKPL